MDYISLAAPLLICAVFAAAYIKRVDIAQAFAKGAVEGLKNAYRLFPTLVFVLLAVSFFCDSGAAGLLAELLSPLLGKLGFPREVIPLAAVRPLSGSAALAVFSDMLDRTDPDSFAGRCAAVLLGSTETTFYTVAVYYSAAACKPGKRVFIPSLTADLAAFLLSALTVRLFYPAG